MDITCPHCNKHIALVGASELRNDYGLSSNSVQHYRARGFPDPILKFGNRMVYLRRDVEDFVEKRSRRNIEKAVETLMRDLEHLPETERQEARNLLEERLGDGGTPARRRSPRK